MIYTINLALKFVLMFTYEESYISMEDTIIPEKIYNEKENYVHPKTPFLPIS